MKNNVMREEINVMQDLSQIIPYNVENMHLYVRRGSMQRFDYKTIYHWHEDVELTYMISGGLDYYVNSEKIVLRPGEGLMTNSGQMHCGDSRSYVREGEDCEYISVVFRPELLQADHALYEKYIRPVIHNDRLPFVLFEKNEEAITKFGRLMTELADIEREESDAYPVTILGKLYEIWGVIFSLVQNRLEAGEAPISDEILKKRMIAYIFENYSQPLYLEMIAGAANVSRSKCCQIFRDQLHQSPIDFLNDYRLNVSRYYVINTPLHFSEIAEKCGFRGQSYFTQCFKERYGLTPREMREKEAQRIAK